MGDVAPLTILVKAPNLKAEDKRVACDRSWSVRQLKEHLSTIYPDKPVSVCHLHFDISLLGVTNVYS